MVEITIGSTAKHPLGFRQSSWQVPGTSIFHSVIILFSTGICIVLLLCAAGNKYADPNPKAVS